MGNVLAKFGAEYELWVKTGDRKGAGTDANVYAILTDKNGVSTKEVKLDNFLRNDHERNSLGCYYIPKVEGMEDPTELKMWRDSCGLADDWYLELVYCTSRTTKEVVAQWPIHRWIKPEKKYHFSLYDCLLPQDDPHMNQRREELTEKRTLYEYTQNIDGGPVQAKTVNVIDLPPELVGLSGFRSKVESKLITSTSSAWSTISDLKNIYKMALTVPTVTARWNDDHWFAAQRLQGLNPFTIKLCDQIPVGFLTAENTREDVDNIRVAFEEKRLFIQEFPMLKNLPCKDDRVMVSPVGLFVLNSKGILTPIGLQLFPENMDDNPVFTPNDAPYTWMLAKMYYNMADAALHRAWYWYGLCHLVVESVWVALNRNVSASHPVYRLLAPHMLNITRVNAELQEKLLSPGGWIDAMTATGMRGFQSLIARAFENFNIMVDLDISKMVVRNQMTEGILEEYPFRDDGILIQEAIREAVSQILHRAYGIDDAVQKDWEINDFMTDLSKPRREGGCQFKGLPVGDNLDSVDHLIIFTTNVISLCTIFTAACSTSQYDQMGFIPSFPTTMRGSIPRDLKVRTERDVMNQLPSKEMTTNIVNTLKLLSSVTTPLGESKEKYLCHPEDILVMENFKKSLERIEEIIDKRNHKRRLSYNILAPKNIPHGVEI